MLMVLFLSKLKIETIADAITSDLQDKEKVMNMSMHLLRNFLFLFR